MTEGGTLSETEGGTLSETEGGTLSETDAGWCLSRSPELPCSFEHCRESIAACVESDKDSICTAPSVPTSTSLAVRRCATNLGQPLYCQMGSGPCHQARSQSSRPLQRTIPKLPEVPKYWRHSSPQATRSSLNSLKEGGHPR